MEPGELIAGKYRVEIPLGRGGMGAVYAARHSTTGRRFAIKLLNPQLAGDPEAEARFLREAKLASAINHPAIVEVYDVGRHGSAPFMVMKLLEGESLGERLKRGPVPPDEAIAILAPVLDGVSAAHAHGIVHRDLKPDNIMLHRERDGAQPKVLDFGISKLLGPDARTRLTKTGISLGTPLYMSPEQVRGDPDVDVRSDVYALGVILYEMLTGALPFEGKNYADLVLKVVMGGARGIRSLNPRLSPELERIVTKAMAVNREHRYASVAEFAADLQRQKGAVSPRLEARVSSAQAPVVSTPFASESLPHPPPRLRLPRPAVYVLAVLGLGVALGALWAMRPRGQGSHASLKAPNVAAAAPAPAAQAETPNAPPAAAPAVQPSLRAETAAAPPTPQRAPSLAHDPAEVPKPVPARTTPEAAGSAPSVQRPAATAERASPAAGSQPAPDRRAERASADRRESRDARGKRPPTAPSAASESAPQPRPTRTHPARSEIIDPFN